jgi:predicted amidohydrolase YtcJ
MRTLYNNAQIYGQKATAFSVKEGVFEAFYETAEPAQYDEVVDLKGRTVLPGFNDAHGHFMGLSYMAKMRSLGTVKTLSDLQTALGGIDGFTMGVHYDDKVLKLRRYLNKSDLDAIEKDQPLMVLRVCGHFAVANTAAIEVAKAYHANRPDAQNVDFDLGHFKEEAIKWLQAPFFNPDVESLKADILWAQDHVLKHGVTAFASDDFITYPVPYERIISAYHDLAQSGALKVRIYQQAHLKPHDLLLDFLNKGYAHQQVGRFKMGPSKLLVDGSLGAQTAAMKAPYQGSENTGLLNYDVETLTQYIQTLNTHRMDYAWHAIGDAATQAIIDATQKAGLYKGAKPSIIHAQLTGQDEVKAMAELGIGALIQPIFLDDDIPVINDYLGDKGQDTYLFKSLYDLVPTALSTDAPIVSIRPFDNLYCAITRTSLKYPEAGAHRLDQALTMEAALRGYTEMGAYFMNEDRLGKLMPGYLADFIVVTGFDPNDVESLKRTTVEMTFIEGHNVYTADSKS